MTTIFQNVNGKEPNKMHNLQDDEEESGESHVLEFIDDIHNSSTLSALNMMRRNRHFCDVILHVGNTEIHAHRAVLASASPYLFELFTSDQDPKHLENVITYKLNGGFDPNALQMLIDYAYTATLSIRYDQVKSIYLAAVRLKMDRVVNTCTQYMINHLNVDNCIEIRSLPGIIKNTKFVQHVDQFITKQFDTICHHNSMVNLHCAKIEILNQSREEMALVNSNSICRLVLEWIKKEFIDENITIDVLSHKTFMLYLANDNSLQDCSSLPTGCINDTEMVQDYKKLAQKIINAKRKNIGQPSKPRVLLFNREIDEPTESEAEVPDWRLITSTIVSENMFLALATLKGRLWALSIQLRLNPPTTPSPINTPDHPSRSSSEEKPELYCSLAYLPMARCACGCVGYNGTLLVCGGYDRRECLRSVEQFFPETNSWRSLKSMREGRGRFMVTIIDDCLYAVGGCNGVTELDSVEALDLKTGKWSTVTVMPLARSSLGVCSLGDSIYCVGGWNGQVGIKQCDAYNVKLNEWSPLAPLNIGRYQAGVAVYKGQLFAIGGCDAWNCLNSVEVYNPESNTWSFFQPIIAARRGCGVAVFNDKLYVVGGSDGTHSLNSTEYYDEEAQSWVVGPSMGTPRANVDLAVVDDRFYAVGGFSGRTFLNTMEYLDLKSNEWTSFVPKINCTTTE